MPKVQKVKHIMPAVFQDVTGVNRSKSSSTVVEDPQRQTTKNNFDSKFREFTNNHKNELKKLDMNLSQVKEEKEALQVAILKYQEQLKTSDRIISEKNANLEAIKAEKEELKSVNAGLKETLEKNMEQFSILEVTYDKNVTQLTKEINELVSHSGKLVTEFDKVREQMQARLDQENELLKTTQEELVQCKDSYMKVKQEFLALQETFEQYRSENNVAKDQLEKSNEASINELRNELHTKEELLKAMRMEIDSTIESKNREIINLDANLKETAQQVAHLEAELKKIEELRNNEISELKAQLALKDYEIKQAHLEKDKLEEYKNKIMEEQTYRMRELERVLAHPVQRVGPTKTKVPTEQNNTTATTSSSAPNENAAAGPSVRAGTKRNLRKNNLNQASKVEPQSAQQPLKDPYLFRTVAKPNGPTNFNNDFSSDDESLRLEWPPLLLLNENTEEDNENVKVSRKRKICDENFVAESSDSDAFDKLKKLNN